MAQAIQQSDAILEDSALILTAVEVTMQGVLLLSRFVPMLKAVGIPAQLALKPVAGLVRRIRAQKAANDEAYEIVTRREAA